MTTKITNANITNTGVSAGSYTNTNLTVNAQGQITAASNGTGGGGTPGGSDTQVQFNDAGSFGGDAGLTYNKTTDTLTTSVVVHGAGTVSAPSITTTGDTNTGVYFPAADTAAITTGGSERMRITSGGTLNIGTTALATSGGFPTPLIYGKQLNNSNAWSGLQLESNTDDSTLGIGFNGTNFILSTSYRSTGNYKNIAIATAATFNTNQTVKFETSISVGGVAPTTSGAGITFPASQSASTDANTLDDYEEGSYTPTDSSGASLSFTNAYGYYTKVGRLVTYNFALTYPSTASGSNARISLPFTQSSGMDANASTGGFMFYVYGTTTSAIMPIISSGSNSINMYFQSSMSDVTNANLSTKTIRGMVIFYT